MKNSLLLGSVNSHLKIFKDKSFILAFSLLALSIWLQADFSTDYIIQKLCFNFTDLTWMVSDKDPVVKFVFYTLPKFLLIIASIALIWNEYKSNRPHKKVNILKFFLCMVFIPLIISLLKKTTNIHCPYDLAAFNGHIPFRSFLDFNTYNHFLQRYENGNCFPAGHASGGFAFMSSYFVLPKKYQKIGVWVGFALGSYMALFQMMKGAHFFSHSLFTFSFTVIFILVVQQFLNPRGLRS